MNRIIIMGRMVKDPELRYTQSNQAVLSFTLAVDRDYVPENGEREVDFIDFVAWRKTAETISKYVSRGQRLLVEGRLQKRSWESDNGTRYAVEVIVDRFDFIERKEESQAQQPVEDYGTPPPLEEDLPF